MNEVSKILEPKEKLIYDNKPEYAPFIISTLIIPIIAIAVIEVSIYFYIKSVLLGIAAGIAIFVGGLVLINLAYKRAHYAITDKRVITQSGIIGRDFKSIDYDKMQNVSVDVGILGTIFKVGTIKIFTGEIESVGSGERSQIQPKYDQFNYIAAPYEVLKKLQTELSKRKRGR